MSFQERRKRRLAAVDNEQEILQALEPFIQRLEACEGAEFLYETMCKLEDAAAEVGAFLADNEANK